MVMEMKITQMFETIDDIQGISPSESNEEVVLYEVHTELDLQGFEDTDETGEGTGLKLPYIVTILQKNNKIYQSDGTMSKWIR